MNFILVGLGGMIGSILRYTCSLYLVQSLSNFVANPTALINLVGSLLMGVMIALEQNRLGSLGALFVMTGVLGGFTTYSAFSAETLNLLREGFYTSAFTYVALTLVGGLAAVSAGYFVTRSIL